MATDTDSLRSRRSILIGALGGLVGGVAAAVGRSVPADAAPQYVVLGDTNDAQHRTNIINVNAGDAFFASATLGSIGIEGDTDYGSGVHGYASSGGYGVSGQNASGGVGVLAYSDTNSAPLPKISSPIGVYGIANSGSAAIGVRGESDTGRGAVLSGPVAQLRLAPSNDATHAASGARGDLVVDRHGRLWYCKGGTDWHRLV